MAFLSVLIAAIAPGIALTAYFYLKDRYISEPIHLVVKAFVIGVLLVFPIMVIQRGLVLGLGDNQLLFSFFISAGVEEAFKWFVFYHVIFSHKNFDEPYDGIVYAVAISLGFATFENVIYAWSYSPSVMTLFMRALLPVSGHALFGVMMGYYFGKARFDLEKQKRYLTIALLLPVLWHGIFDYVLLIMKTNWIWIIAPLMIYLWILGMSRVNRANARSPFRTLFGDEEISGK